MFHFLKNFLKQFAKYKKYTQAVFKFLKLSSIAKRLFKGEAHRPYRHRYTDANTTTATIPQPA
ncbi:MAG: hypothetical protein LBJ00_00025 [Planctomycetaceae bacterium]|nr:hypothetical protein [Planctomycetaceae bacterium]